MKKSSRDFSGNVLKDFIRRAFHILFAPSIPWLNNQHEWNIFQGFLQKFRNLSWFFLGSPKISLENSPDIAWDPFIRGLVCKNLQNSFYSSSRNYTVNSLTDTFKKSYEGSFADFLQGFFQKFHKGFNELSKKKAFWDSFQKFFRVIFRKPSENLSWNSSKFSFENKLYQEFLQNFFWWILRTFF